MKKCKDCLLITSLDNFYIDERCKDKKGAICKACSAKRLQKWRSKNPQKVKEGIKRNYDNDKDAYRNRSLIYKYNITLEDYNIMLNNQKGLCRVCGIDRMNLRKNLSVDHCHKTGKVRGLLCERCNTALGLLKEDIKIMRNLINYMELENDK